ncbi:MAG: mechanosensitive ion channel domain-containing protein [Desulfovibrio sp.]|uniref:mechanosensitive ion channel domain-containing protein n=1 Tax=Desulfovibrio sp. 7SRBS1 TaxID=3378064 RepID=UPI003B4042C9
MVVEKDLQLLQQYWDLVLSLHMETLIALAFVAALLVLFRITLTLFARRLNVPDGVVRSIKWAFLLCLVYAVERLIVVKVASPLLDTPLILTKIVLWWLFIRNMLDGVYADIYIRRVKKTAVNHYFIDLCKFLVVLVLVISAIKSVFNIDPASILTSSAILTAIIGLSMQDTIGSLISGLLIQFEKPFSLGDWIQVGPLTGKVVTISWRYTKIQTINRDYILIPNNSISKDSLTNYSQPISRVRREIPVPVPLDVPPVKVKAALAEVVKNSHYVARRPKARIRADEYKEDRVIYSIVFFANRYEDLRAAQDELISSIWYHFRKHGIDLPYPVRELRRPTHRAFASDTNVVEQLKAIPLFEGLAPETLDKLIHSSATLRFDESETIVSTGDLGTTLYVIIDGSVVVRKDGAQLAELGPGDFFGEMALLTGEARQADVEAKEPTRCLEVDREAFRLVLEKEKGVLNNIKAIFDARSVRPTGPLGPAGHTHDSLFNRFRKIFL